MQNLIKLLKISVLLLSLNSFFTKTCIAQTCANTDVTTLAGGSKGSADGNGTTASFDTPYGMTSDVAGNIYVTDRGNHTIRKITPNGNVTTIAGMLGVPGFADGIGAAAQFNDPTSVAADDSGNIYVSDRNNRRIRKISATMVVSTLAGSGIRGSDDGIGAAATFHFPTGITMSVDGNLYVADASTVRKINPATGEVTTIAGSFDEQINLDGQGTAARFQFAHGITSDPSGILYVSEFGEHVIRKITIAGFVSTIAGDNSRTGGTQDGTGTAAQFNFTSGLASDASGNIFIADQGSDLIRKMTPAGVVTTFTGLAYADGFVNGPLDQATFNGQTAIGIDGFGNIYVSEIGNNAVRKIGNCAAPAPVTFGFSASLSASNPSNCNTGNELYYADTLTIPATGTLQTGLDFRINTATDFYTGVPCTTGALRGSAVGRSGLMTADEGLGGTEIKETAPGSGVYKLPFWATTSTLTAITVIESRNPTAAPPAALPDVLTSSSCSISGVTINACSNGTSGTETVIIRDAANPTCMASIQAPICSDGSALSFNFDRIGTSGNFEFVVDGIVVASGDAGAFGAVVLPGAIAAAATAPIPTMSQWGLLIFGLLIMNMSVFFIGRVEFKQL